MSQQRNIRYKRELNGNFRTERKYNNKNLKTQWMSSIALQQNREDKGKNQKT